MGLRSLVKAEKRLRERHGTLVLAAVREACASGARDGAAAHRFAARWPRSTKRCGSSVRAASRPSARVRSLREGRACAVLAARRTAACSNVGWASGHRHGNLEADRLATFTIDDLAFAVGSGGFGATREQASEATGPLIAARAFAGLRTPGTHDPSDFLVPERPADALVHVASALGIDGSPDVALHIGSDAPFAVADLVDDVLAAARDDAGPRPAATAILALVADLADQPTAGDLMCRRAPIGGSHATRARASPRLAEWLPGRDVRTTAGPSSGEPCCCRPRRPSRRLPRDPADVLTNVGDARHARGGRRHRSRPGACTAALAWSFQPSRLREGREKLLAVHVEDGTPMLDEWETIARRLYRDCRRVVLTPLHGGFMSNTFRVASYDPDGRRMLPTVLKIGDVALTEREEVANRKYVQTFILNNSTTLLGGAAAGRLGRASIQLPRRQRPGQLARVAARALPAPAGGGVVPLVRRAVHARAEAVVRTATLGAGRAVCRPRSAAAVPDAVRQRRSRCSACRPTASGCPALSSAAIS